MINNSIVWKEMLGLAYGPASFPASGDSLGFDSLTPNVNWVDISFPQAGPFVNNVQQMSGVTAGKVVTLSVNFTGSVGTVYRKVSSTSFTTADYALSGPGWTATPTGTSFTVNATDYVGFTRIQAKTGAALITIQGSVFNTIDTFNTTIT